MQGATNVFYDAIENTPDVRGHFCNGLSAMGANSVKVKPNNNKLIDGSLDIDSATHSLYPNESRWDYAISYGNNVYYIEVHPANTSNVSEVIKKLQWLKRWLETKAPLIKALSSQNCFYWIFTNKYAISRGSHQERMLAMRGIKIVKYLVLS